MIAKMDSPERLWRTQFDRQLTDEVTERVLKQTIALIRRLERRTPWRDQLGPDDRLNSVILKMLDGRRKWDFERVDLERFLLWAIAGDLTHEIEHGKRFRHDSLDDDRLDQEELERETAESMADERVVKTEVPKEVWWSKFVDQMREHAKGDVAVLAMVDAYCAGKFERRDVMGHTRLTTKQYHAAYQRLLRVAQKIDADVLAMITQAIA
jgi:hypothetical protein